MLDTCWATRVAFDMDDVVAPGVHELRAAGSTVGQMLVPTLSASSKRGRSVRDAFDSAAVPNALWPNSWRGPPQTFRARAILDRSGNWLADIRRRCRRDIGNPRQV
jgi:hypothetical protein